MILFPTDLLLLGQPRSCAGQAPIACGAFKWPRGRCPFTVIVGRRVGNQDESDMVK